MFTLGWCFYFSYLLFIFTLIVLCLILLEFIVVWWLNIVFVKGFLRLCDTITLQSIHSFCLNWWMIDIYRSCWLFRFIFYVLDLLTFAEIWCFIVLLLEWLIFYWSLFFCPSRSRSLTLILILMLIVFFIDIFRIILMEGLILEGFLCELTIFQCML